MNEEKRFFAKTRRDDETGCLEWTGSRNRKGYGQIWVGGRVEAAHRLAWTLRHGQIPPGAHVLHACDNPGCVEERHLFTGTNAENARDREQKGRGVRCRVYGAANGQARLSAPGVLEARRRRRAGETFASIGRSLGVDETTVLRACRGETWSRIPT